MEAVQITLLLIIANGAPLVVSQLLGSAANRPIDGGLRLPDNHYLFGESKTWRGLIGSVLLTTGVAFVVRTPEIIGLVIAVGAMLGDLFTSFIKRRCGLASSAKFTWLDQVPEAILPMLLVVCLFDVSATSAVIAAVMFVLGDILLSPLLFKLGWRRVPH